MLLVPVVLLMSSVTVIACSGGLFWLKPIAMVLFMLCSAVLVEWLLLKPCCVGCCLCCMRVVSSPVVLLSLREGDGSVLCAYVRVFVWFWNWYDVC